MASPSLRRVAQRPAALHGRGRTLKQEARKTRPRNQTCSLSKGRQAAHCPRKLSAVLPELAGAGALFWQVR